LPVFTHKLTTVTKNLRFVGKQLRDFFAHNRVAGRLYDRLVQVSFLSREFLTMPLREFDDVIIGFMDEDEDFNIYTPNMESVLFAVNANHEEIGRLTWGPTSDHVAADIFRKVDPDDVRYLCLVSRILWIHPSFAAMDRWSLVIEVHMRPPSGIRPLLKPS
jgi:hypothetical protein